jgi:glycosyltransferase involved in cell wall biosynthesis
MAHKNWLFNILIRSSGRPKYFATCISRIREQTYRHYRLYVACDDNDTACYLEKYKDIEVIRVNPVTDNPPPRSATFGRGFRPFFPNLYLNGLLALVEHGFIIFLDDDDCFIRPDALAIINDAIDSEDDLVFWKVMFSKTRTVPDEAHFEQVPKFTQINTSGFTFNRKYAESARWDAWSGADYFVAKKLYNLVPSKKYIAKKLTGMQEPYGIAGHGHRLDKVVNDVDLKNHFETTGYAPPFRLFTPKQIREIWQWISKDPKVKPMDWEKGLAVNSRFFFELSTHEHLMQRVIAILGKDVILWGCSIVARPPGTAHPWHCDIEAAAITQGRTVNA